MNTVPHALLKHDAALVRIMQLDARAISPAHYHTEVHEHIVCLEGEISVYTGDAVAPTSLKSGDHCSIERQTAHYLRNESDTISKYLLIQSGGRYDFIEIGENLGSV